MRIARFALVALLLPFAVSSCGGDDDGGSTGPDTSVFGTYSLETVAGAGLPYIVLQAGVEKIEITAGSWRINSDNTWSSSVSVRATNAAGQTNTFVEPSAGTFTRSGNSFVFTDAEDASQQTGSVSGDVLTIIDQAVAFTFRK
ncbi:hypothetical protein ACFL5T_02725 [Gemmatimonadota bacterium]